MIFMFSKRPNLYPRDCDGRQYRLNQYNIAIGGERLLN